MRIPREPAFIPASSTRRLSQCVNCVLVCIGLWSGALSAADKIVGPGETLVLERDLVLTGDDTFEIRGTAEKPAVLEGQFHKIRSSENWSGRFKIVHCRILRLGSRENYTADRQRLLPDCEALVLAVSGKGEVIIENCLFDQSNSLEITNRDQSTTQLRNNTVLDNALYPIDTAAELSRGFLIAKGSSAESKFFQGNRIDRGSASFHSPNWLIGGHRSHESNILVGMRVGIFAAGAGTVVRGNFLHQLLPVSVEHPYWSQVSTFSSKHLAEHNVIREGHWVCRGIEGEFRNNLVLEAHGHNHLQIGKARVHHNIFARGSRTPDRLGTPVKIPAVSSINQVYATDGFEVYNNTFDGEGLSVGAIELPPDTFMPSLRNNVFFNFTTARIVGPAYNEKNTAPSPARLGYADYNLFFNPQVKNCINYAVSVRGKTERQDEGFARNDVPRSGRINEQADPKFKGPIPELFPFSDDEIKAGKVSVEKILAVYRERYSPSAGSPLVNAGDPADGTGSWIGAVGPGVNAASDQFGRFLK